MKLNHPALVATLAAASLLIGCGPGKETPVSEISSDASNAQEQLAQTAAAIKDSAAATKDEFVAQTDKRLADLDAQIAELQRKSGTYKDEAKVHADQALASLKEQREKVAVQYEKLKAASVEAWSSVRAGFSNAMDELDKAFESARAKFQ